VNIGWLYNKIKAIQNKVNVHLNLHDIRWLNQSLLGQQLGCLDLSKLDLSLHISSSLWQ